MTSRVHAEMFWCLHVTSAHGVEIACSRTVSLEGWKLSAVDRAKMFCELVKFLRQGSPMVLPQGNTDYNFVTPSSIGVSPMYSGAIALKL